MRMFLISDNVDTCLGMKLAGVNGVVAHTITDFKLQLEKAVNDKTIGVIIITEKFSRDYPELIDDVKLNRRLPLIVEIPDRHGTGRRPDFITAYVNEAIGLKL